MLVASDLGSETQPSTIQAELGGETLCCPSPMNPFVQVKMRGHHKRTHACPRTCKRNRTVSSPVLWFLNKRRQESFDSTRENKSQHARDLGFVRKEGLITGEVKKKRKLKADLCVSAKPSWTADSGAVSTLHICTGLQLRCCVAAALLDHREPLWKLFGWRLTLMHAAGQFSKWKCFRAWKAAYVRAACRV